MLLEINYMNIAEFKSSEHFINLAHFPGTSTPLSPLIKLPLKFFFYYHNLF